MERNKNIVVNIPADGLEEEVIRRTDLSEETYKQLVKAYIKEFAEDTACGRMFFNVCYKRSVVHSNTADTYLYNIVRDDNGFPILDGEGNLVKELSPEVTVSPLNRGYRKMLERDIDIIKMAVTEAKACGMEAWLSVRMNDHHYPDDRGFNSSFAYDRAETLGVQGIGIEGARQYMDYTKPAVQNYYKNYIQELCENYDIDGIELDFLRSCPVMSVVNEENIRVMNGYVSSIKEVANIAAGRSGKTWDWL